MSNGGNGPIAPNAKRLLWAGFMAILAAGVGFGIRGGILDNWGAEFGFTGAQLGAINGAGFTGFCFGIIIGGVIADKIGYGKLVIAAILFHLLSAFVTFAASPGMGQGVAYQFLYWGTFIFAVANGTLEAVANPLIATLFPHNRTHYLNILHASWPAGLILGGAAGWVLDDQLNWHWKLQLALFIVPTVVYGLMFMGQAMPKSEASKLGLSLGEMFKDVGLLGGLVVCFLLSLFFESVFKPLLPAEVAGSAKYIGYAIGGVLLIAIGSITKFSPGSVLLFVLFCVHALVGAVELGTDGWIQNITGNILTSGQGKMLFVWTSAVMFALRFCADFIEKRLGLSPVGILLVCAVLACLGLNLTSNVNSFGMALLALTVYGVGKTFFWPTMLAVASDRFPRTGAVAISIMGGIGMMSAGLIGSAGLGYCKDRFSGEALAEVDQDLYQEYQAEQSSSFLFFDETNGLDPKRLAGIQETLNSARTIIETGEVAPLDDAAVANMSSEDREKAEAAHARLLELEAKLKDLGAVPEGGGGDPEDAMKVLTDDERKAHAASIAGDRKTLVADSAIPATMALIYLLLMLYFKSIGGYKVIHIDGTTAPGHEGEEAGDEENKMTEWGPGEG